MKSSRSIEVQATAGRDAGIVALQAELFDSTDVPLGKWPAAHSLEGRFLSRLLRGRELTAGDWLGDARSMRLAAEVHELRELGWRVATTLKTVTTRDRGRKARIGLYSLDERQRAAAAASERGRRFIAAVDATEGRAR